MILIIIPIIILLLLNLILVHSLRKEANNSKNETSLVNISIIISAKNETENIENLIDSIKSLDYPIELFEVIIVDDNSTDRTAEKLNLHLDELKNLSEGIKANGKHR